MTNLSALMNTVIANQQTMFLIHIYSVHMTEERWKVPGFQGIELVENIRFEITPSLNFKAGLSPISERS